MNALYTWQMTTNRFGLQLDVYNCENGRTYYLLRDVRPWHTMTLLELEIDAHGRRLDYLKLDTFWGRAPRPIL